MMLTKIKALSTAETTALLRHHLGPLRSWGFFLADNIRGRQNIAGFTLMPSLRLHNGRNFCPAYSAAIVMKFIKDVQAAVPAARPTKAKALTVEIDAAINWRYIKRDQDGRVCKHRILAHARTI